MRVAGWTLIVMAVVLHFSACEWVNPFDPDESRSSILPFVPFVHARGEHFYIRGRGYDTMRAGLWGLVIPIGLTGGGIGLIRRAPPSTIRRKIGGWLRRVEGSLRSTKSALVLQDRKRRWLRRAGGWLSVLSDSPRRLRVSFLTWVIIAAGGVTVALLAGILLLYHSGKGKQVYAREINPLAGTDAIAMFDTDKDGKIGRAELAKCPGLKAALSKVDPINQGITADMIAARIKVWKKSRLGGMLLYCRVTNMGLPLAGAEVRFVPEKFLGPNIQEAKGTTDQYGTAMLSVPTKGPGDPPGVAPGFYRVEITKPGQNIPAKYNTETILGQEVALDAKGIQEGIYFDLVF